MGTELEAGPNQMLVVYISGDSGGEVDPLALYGQVAADASRRAGAGQRIVSMTSMSLRHAQAFMSREGSGYETKIAVTVVYATA